MNLNKDVKIINNVKKICKKLFIFPIKVIYPKDKNT